MQEKSNFEICILLIGEWCRSQRTIKVKPHVKYMYKLSNCVKATVHKPRLVKDCNNHEYPAVSLKQQLRSKSHLDLFTEPLRQPFTNSPYMKDTFLISDQRYPQVSPNTQYDGSESTIFRQLSNPVSVSGS